MNKNMFSKAILSISLALMVAGCATTPLNDVELGPLEKQEKVSALLHQAEKDFQDHNLPSALLRYEQVFEYDVDNRQARLGAANSSRELGNYEKAVEYFDMVLKKNPDDLDALEGKGIALFKAGDYAKARQQLSDVLTSDKNRWRAINALGVLEDLDGNYSASAKYYYMALEIEPNNVLIMNNLGYSLIMAHEYSHAESVLRKGLNIEPGYFRIRNNLAISLSWQKKYQDAVDVLVVDMPYDIAYNNVGYIALLNHDYSNAVYYFKKAISASPRYYVEAARNLERAEKKIEGLRKKESMAD